MQPAPLLNSPAADPHLPAAPRIYSSGSPAAGGSGAGAHASRGMAGSAAGGGGRHGTDPTPPPQTAPASADGPARSASGRAKGPPMRSTTMDDAYYVGPGEPSALTRGKAPAAAAAGMLYGAIGTVPPRAPAMYGQGNHSSPSLVESGSPELLPANNLPPLDSSSEGPPTATAGSSFTPFDMPDLAYMAAVDDLNIGLEHMRFDQSRPASGSTVASGRASIDPLRQQQQQGRRYSPSSIGSVGQAGPDGAMEIRGYGGGDGTASVYSLDGKHGVAHGGVASSSAAAAWDRAHRRQDSASSSRVHAAFDAQDFQRRDSYGTAASSVEGYSEVDPSVLAARRASEGSYLSHDDGHYSGGMSQPRMSNMQHAQSAYSHADYFAGPGPGASSSTPYFPPPGGPEPGYYAGPSALPQDRYAAGPPPGSVKFPQSGTFAGPPPSAGTFSPQPGHAGAAGSGGSSWGHDYSQAAAAQNPYYAAATGQLGLDPGAMGPPGGAQMNPYGAIQQRGISSMSSLAPTSTPGGTLSRSASSLNVPGGPMRRKTTSTSVNTTASSSSSGPIITKASIDEYRQRVKADPDPEAQFNFAKYLIEAAKRLNSGANADDRVAKKYRDALLAESLKLIKRLATQGSGLGKAAYADAQFFLANCLGTGSLGLQIDHEKAYNLYVQASKQNHSAATYRTAVCNELGAGTRKDYARAVLFYRKASALGDTAGMYKLGMILLHGHLGQQRNPKEGLAWLRRAASQADDENPHALHELGLLHEKPPLLNPAGAGSLGAKVAAAQLQQQQQQAAQAGQPPPPIPTLVPYDPAQAREFFTQAAQLGYPPSQYKLGLCYEFGALTCVVDPRRSIAWYTRAAERNEPNAELALSGWYLTGSDGVLKQSDSEAYLWARRAANKGLPKAEYAVGYYAEVGIGVKADMEEAKRWYMRAAAQGNKRAMQRLTELKKLGADRRGAGGKKRPTRKDAETECTVM
ncbi:hypothetical protein JCM8202_005479 [Rhodotorula sphaerocarpa]